MRNLSVVSLQPSKPVSLRERLPVFARSVPEAEVIDDLVLTPAQRSAQRADFFFKRRRIICETKTLVEDPTWKIDDRLKPYQKRPEWPVFYGAWELSKILRKFPDGADINRRVFEAITNAIQKAITDANRQIRDTKNTFDLPHSGGLLILGNDSIRILSPVVIAHRVKRTLTKRTPSGEPQFPHINTVWMISENYVIELPSGQTAIPALIYQNEIPDPANVEGYTDDLQRHWAAFHGAPLHINVGANLDDVRFRDHPSKSKRSEPGPKRRWQLWEEEYDSNPYLAHLSVPRLIRHAEQLFARITPGMLVRASASQQSEAFRAMQPWTHFLREVNRRGLDMREFSPMVRNLGTRIRAGERIDSVAHVGRNDLCPCASGKKYKHCHGRVA
jgi:SEC-C motif